MIEKISLTELYKGTSVYINDVRYESAKTYIKPFLDKLSQKDYKLNILIKRNEERSVYDKVLVEAFFQETIYEKYNNVLCFTYSIDIANPIVKMYQCIYNKDKDLLFSSNYCKMYETEDFNNIKYDNIDDFLTFNKGSYKYCESFNKKILTRYIKDKLGYCLCDCKNTIVTYESNNIVSISDTIFLNISRYISEDFSFDHNLIDLYKLLYNDVIKNQKDLSNQFEKFFIVGYILNKNYSV